MNYSKYPRQLKVGDRAYTVFYEKALKATSSVKIRKEGVVLRLSRFSFGYQRDEMVKKFLKWAEKKLSKVSKNDFVMPVYKDGGRICTHNKIYELRVKGEDRKNCRAYTDEQNVIHLFLSDDLAVSEREKYIQRLVEKVIIADQTEYLREVIDELNQLYFQERYNLCRFKRSSSRFGSCSSKRNINISYRLLFAPREVFRYVCAHELAHLKQMNHSKKFWALVASAIPDYKKHEKWLRDSGFMLG